MSMKCPACGHITKVTTQTSGPLVLVTHPAAQPEHPTQQKEPATEAIARYGVLVVHDEKTPQQTYSLKLGLNTIGMQSQQYPANFNIHSADTFMSRLHCTLEVKLEEGKLQYIIQDGGKAPDGSWKYSTNGTYLNGQETKLTQQDRLYLKESDFIQVGETKIVVKVAKSDRTLQQAAHEVNAVSHLPTVKING